MLALCLMLLGTYYAQNYAGIIGGCLMLAIPSNFDCQILKLKNWMHKQALNQRASKFGSELICGAIGCCTPPIAGLVTHRNTDYQLVSWLAMAI